MLPAVHITQQLYMTWCKETVSTEIHSSSYMRLVQEPFALPAGQVISSCISEYMYVSAVCDLYRNLLLYLLVKLSAAVFLNVCMYYV